jgi:hypothetical protein
VSAAVRALPEAHPSPLPARQAGSRASNATSWQRKALKSYGCGRNAADETSAADAAGIWIYSTVGHVTLTESVQGFKCSPVDSGQEFRSIALNARV